MPSTDDEPSRRRPGWPVGREHRHGSHVHHRFPRQGRRPAMPQRPSTSTPQTFLVTTRPDRTALRLGRPDAGRNPRQGSPQPSPHPPGSSWWFRLRGFMTLVPHVRLSVSLARPRPSGSTGPSRRCQGCFPPSPASPGSGCPQLQPACCDSPAVKVSHPHSNPQRLVAHFVDEPPVTASVPARPCSVDKLRCEGLHSPIYRHVVDLDAALGQQLFDVAVGQPVAQIPAHRDRDHLTSKPIFGGCGRGSQTDTITQQVSRRTPTQQSRSTLRVCAPARHSRYVSQDRRTPRPRSHCLADAAEHRRGFCGWARQLLPRRGFRQRLERGAGSPRAWTASLGCPASAMASAHDPKRAAAESRGTCAQAPEPE